MTPNYLVALGPGGEQPPSQDTQKQLEKERCFGENSHGAVPMGTTSIAFLDGIGVLTASTRGVPCALS